MKIYPLNLHLFPPRKKHQKRYDYYDEFNMSFFLAAVLLVTGTIFLILKHAIGFFVASIIVSSLIVIHRLREIIWARKMIINDLLLCIVQKKVEEIQAKGKCQDFDAHKIAELMLIYDEYTRIYRLDDLKNVNDEQLEMKMWAALYASEDKLFVWRVGDLPMRARRRVRPKAGQVAVCGFCRPGSMLNFEAATVVNLEEEKQRGSDMACFNSNKPVWFRWVNGAAVPLTLDEISALQGGYYGLLISELQE